jgi:hypothetical protein
VAARAKRVIKNNGYVCVVNRPARTQVGCFARRGHKTPTRRRKLRLIQLFCFQFDFNGKTLRLLETVRRGKADNLWNPVASAANVRNKLVRHGTLYWRGINGLLSSVKGSQKQFSHRSLSLSCRRALRIYSVCEKKFSSGRTPSGEITSKERKIK